MLDTLDESLWFVTNNTFNKFKSFLAKNQIFDKDSSNRWDQLHLYRSFKYNDDLCLWSNNLSDIFSEDLNIVRSTELSPLINYVGCDLYEVLQRLGYLVILCISGSYILKVHHFFDKYSVGGRGRGRFGFENRSS